jgi:acetylornithine deacetylase/succinyl-diaminopimelate desuccinylase-like protein
MLTINPNEEKTITFVVEIDGVGCDEMNGYVRFNYGEVEYGFPVEFHGDEITATIKPLNSIFEGKLKNGMTLAARLDLAAPAHNYYFNPWADEIEIKMPVSVEARIVDANGTTSGPSVKAKVISEKKRPTKTKTEGKKSWTSDKLKNITEEQIIKYMERAGSKNKMVQEIILNEARTKAAEAGKTGNLAVLQEVVNALKKPK